MPLADYFPRDAVAISQVLKGFSVDAFAKQLESTRVAISFGKNAAENRDGRELLDLSIRLLARLYPTLSIVSASGDETITSGLVQLAQKINPNIATSSLDAPDIVLAVGSDAPAVDAPTVYAGCDGWVGTVGTQSAYGTSDLGNPFGAGFAACIAAANIFRFLFLPDGLDQLDEDTSFPSDAASFPCLSKRDLSNPLHLVGAGAIGNSAAWALSRTPLAGEIVLIDPEPVELSNLQRYVLCVRTDERRTKVQVLGEAFRKGLKPRMHQAAWSAFAETSDYKWERVLVALDSARDRRAVQWGLPNWIANAWTQVGDLGVSVHSFLGQDACLACLYLPDRQSISDDEVIATGLRIPEMQTRVRHLLGTGDGADREICDAIANAWGIPTEKLDAYVGRPIRALWSEGVCGGAVIPLGAAGSAPQDLQVPLAFQSALAGVLLAAEAVLDVLTCGTERRTSVRRVDLLRQLGDTSPRPEPKAGTGRCICEDQDFVDTYRSKYGYC